VSILELLVLAVGLSMDATAVAAARGLSAPRVGVREAGRVAFAFGGFQAAMPALGWVGGAFLGDWANRWGGWIAGGVLLALGGKMLREAWAAPDDEHAPGATDPFAWRVLLPLAVATSIDALAAGVSLRLMGAPVGIALVTIGCVTAVLSAAAALGGRGLGDAAGSRINALGGIVLVLLGARFGWQAWAA
jgi:putative Mn2+ efflux pump MntP